MIRRTLAHYRILEKLGSGGMGEVYVAEDTKLARKVALKVLPEAMATGERLSRFEREAKAIAALNHPNIVTVYSVEEAEGVHFITMELVRGKTLSELLPKNGFPLSKFFNIAIPRMNKWKGRLGQSARNTDPNRRARAIGTGSEPEI